MCLADVATKQNAYQIRDPGTTSHQAGINCVSLICVSSAVTDKEKDFLKACSQCCFKSGAATRADLFPIHSTLHFRTAQSVRQQVTAQFVKQLRFEWVF